MEFKCFCQITIDPYSGSTIWDVLKEMKSLSKIVGLPVGAKFNNWQLLIKSDTNIDVVAQFYNNGIDCDYAWKIKH